MNQWRWTSDKTAEIVITDGQLWVTISVTGDGNRWWSRFRIGGEESYLRSIFGTPEEASEAAVKEAVKALSSAMREVKRIPATLPPRPRRGKVTS